MNITWKSDLIIKSIPLYHIVYIFCIETIEGHVKYQLKNA